MPYRACENILSLQGSGRTRSYLCYFYVHGATGRDKCRSIKRVPHFLPLRYRDHEVVALLPHPPPLSPTYNRFTSYLPSPITHKSSIIHPHRPPSTHPLDPPLTYLPSHSTLLPLPAHSLHPLPLSIHFVLPSSRSEHCQNTKFSRSRLPPSPEKKSANQNTQDSSLTSKS